MVTGPVVRYRHRPPKLTAEAVTATGATDADVAVIVIADDVKTGTTHASGLIADATLMIFKESSMDHTSVTMGEGSD